MGKTIEVDVDVLREAIDAEMRVFAYGSDLETKWKLAGSHLIDDVLQQLREYPSARCGEMSELDERPSSPEDQSLVRNES